jgi:lantibiotic modifying enzyme
LSVLFTPESHEPLVGGDWDESRARDAIARIVADAEEALPDGGLWAPHPRDADGADVFTGIYMGAAGVVWALEALQRAGAVELRRDYRPVIERALERYLERPDFDDRVPSFWMGESGILLVAWRLDRDESVADRLFACCRDNVGNETNEIMWGSPGTMLVARAMLEWTGDARWAAVWRESAERLWADRREDGLWTQHLYGRVREFVGPAHGFAGNVRALMNGADLLEDRRRAELVRDSVDVVRKEAVTEAGLANWPPTIGAGLVPDDDDIRVQWCHGAPGIVASLADLAPEDDGYTALLTAGAELTWRAGPLVKGPGLCHGTAGNGYAFLALHRRTGDALWLERARAFAMHAVDQVERAARGRYSLWTGDIGGALYLWSCLSEDARFPTIDVL